MTKEREYLLTLGMVDDADMEEVEDLMQQLLMDLYEQGQVESVHVTKGGPPGDKDLLEFIDIIDDVETEHIRRAIDLVRGLEDIEDVDG